MGKGDKKSKRGKIVIGSFGVRRARKKKTVSIVRTEKPKVAPVAETEEPLTEAVKTAVKKTVKKTAEPADTVQEKPKAPRTRKKAAAPESEKAPEPESTPEPREEQ